MIAVWFLLLTATAMAQRSSYLGNSGSDTYPGLLPRFKQNASVASGGDLGDRLGGGQAVAVEERPVRPEPAGGTLWDQQTLDRVAQLPKDKQPFWYINRVHIQQHQQSKGGSNVTQQ